MVRFSWTPFPLVILLLFVGPAYPHDNALSVDFAWMKQHIAEDCGFDAEIRSRTDELACLGLWGPNARTILQTVADRRRI